MVGPGLMVEAEAELIVFKALAVWGLRPMGDLELPEVAMKMKEDKEVGMEPGKGRM